MSKPKPKPQTDWTDPKWSLPNVHIAGNGSFHNAEGK